MRNEKIDPSKFSGWNAGQGAEGVPTHTGLIQEKCPGCSQTVQLVTRLGQEGLFYIEHNKQIGSAPPRRGEHLPKCHYSNRFARARS